MTTEAAKRVAHRYLTKLAGDKVELKVKHPDAKNVSLSKGSRGWTYSYMAANGATNSWVNKDRGVAKAKLIYALKSVLDPRDVEKTVAELDKKYDSGHRPPSKKEQKAKIVEDAKAALKGLDVKLPDGWQHGPMVDFLTTERDAPKVQRKLKQFGLKGVRVLDSEDSGHDDPKYPKEVLGDPEDLFET